MLLEQTGLINTLTLHNTSKGYQRMSKVTNFVCCCVLFNRLEFHVILSQKKVYILNAYILLIFHCSGLKFCVIMFYSRYKCKLHWVACKVNEL